MNKFILKPFYKTTITQIKKKSEIELKMILVHLWQLMFNFYYQWYQSGHLNVLTEPTK